MRTRDDTGNGMEKLDAPELDPALTRIIEAFGLEGSVCDSTFGFAEEELSISLLCSMGPRLRENLEELGLRPQDEVAYQRPSLHRRMVAVHAACATRSEVVIGFGREYS